MKHIAAFFLSFVTLFSSSQIRPQYEISTNSSLNDLSIENEKWTNQRWFHATGIAVPLLVTGFALMPADDPIRNRVFNRYGNNGVNHSFDDYIYFAPLTAQLVTAMAGVKGTSGGNRWKVLVADAAAATALTLVVNGLKYSINKKRPNGDDSSFPSGHTATAFMGATLLAHEYGKVSVWIPIAGYSLATATGIMRIMNNRHYVSDVVVGAAIGILCAEFGYWVSDKIFKDDKKVFKDVTHDVY